MTLNVAILLLRFGIIVLLFLFLGQVLLLIRSDLRRTSAQRPESRGRLRVIESGASNLSKGDSLTLLGVNSLGRNPESSLPVFDESVSSEHLLVSYDGEAWRAEDLGSTNGTYVNGQRLQKSVVLAYGDLVQLGRTKLKLEKPPVD
ncbi:MAG: FHA domain-containing protein [Dehalococcoidia bacterium]|nr:FHA domain-containing protein [Dehalococcoidia bacterium]